MGLRVGPGSGWAAAVTGAGGTQLGAGRDAGVGLAGRGPGDGAAEHLLEQVARDTELVSDPSARQTLSATGGEVDVGEPVRGSPPDAQHGGGFLNRQEVRWLLTHDPATLLCSDDIVYR